MAATDDFTPNTMMFESKGKRLVEPKWLRMVMMMMMLINGLESAYVLHVRIVLATRH